MVTYFSDQGLYESRREHDSCGVGAVANISGEKSHDIIEYGKQVLLNLDHRGAASADGITGDGAGILFQVPDAFFRAELKRKNIQLPDPGTYGVGFVFNSKTKKSREAGQFILEEAISHYGMTVLGWRDVPVNPSCLGEIALASEPSCRQVFVHGNGLTEMALERRLYVARKRAEKQVREQLDEDGRDFYLASMSARTICYKGMFMASQLFDYYPDLADSRVVSAVSLVHQRYSTNTLPNWQLAQPFRYVSHNGEINTLSGNLNQMRIRETTLRSEVYGNDIADLLPVLDAAASDSASFDNMLEFLAMNGRSFPHSMMMMIPEAFGPKYQLSSYKRAFYEYHAAIMEPWDGPAAMLFTDGQVIGGTLDRNGLRPAKYLVTTDGLVVLASETGVVSFAPERIAQRGRLKPGRMFLVDTREKRIITDHEIKGRISRQQPYNRWLEDNRIELRGLFSAATELPVNKDTYARRMRLFGYTEEELAKILVPMAMDGQEPIGSMGNDEPLAFLSERPRLLFDYFKQLFAQVTNPPIDPLREALVMSLMSFTGRKHNLLEETPSHCRQLKLPHPVLTNEDVGHLLQASNEDFRVVRIDALFDSTTGDPGPALERGLVDLIRQAEEAIAGNAALLILSDRGVTRSRAAIPSLLALSWVHHQLVERRLRGSAGLVVESGEPREVMHFCLLCGCGANAVNPYMVFEACHQLRQDGMIPSDIPASRIVDNYIAAVKKGILKTMSKMGISTLRSYHSAKLFEAIGLGRAFVQKYFPGISSRISGMDMDAIAAEILLRHEAGFRGRAPGETELDYGGRYHYRNDGEKHKWNPTTISKLQHAVFRNDPEAYRVYSDAVNDESRDRHTIRGLFQFVPQTLKAIPLEEVEPAAEIVKRFCTGAVSHGSISAEAHECMAVAMNRLGGMSNTGEGGEDPSRYVLEPNGDSRNCAIKQVASGRFGVTIHYLAHATEIQIKMAQGAKPGEGGQLPGHKVTEEIAGLRYSTPGVSLISPPPHHDIYSIEDLAQLIYDLKCANPGGRVSVKLVSEVGVGTIAAGVAKGNADEVLISGHDGGTGASPWSSIKHAGCPWELGIAEAQQVMVLNGLRGRTRLQADGGMKSGRDIVVAALLGAERFGFGTAVLVCMGCTLLRKCHLGTCSYGIATQLPELRARFRGKPEYIERFMLFVAQEVREWMAKLGFRRMDEMIGRTECLEMSDAISHYKSRGLDLSAILHRPTVGEGVNVRWVESQPDKLADHLDWTLLKDAATAIEKRKKVKLSYPIRNIHRTIGTILSNRIVLRHGPAGLPEDTIDIEFSGSAGQSFGAFLAPGVTLRLVGDSNDYLGKGLSGGRIVLRTPSESRFIPHENIIAGNTLMYGATGGEVFINGMVGERFCVRNSGAIAVVEGVGDHGCEYMTGGTVIILGKTGCNFAAGMSGGTAYVLDEFEQFDTLCNLDMVDLENVWRQEDTTLLRSLIEKHRSLTASARAEWILDMWDDVIGRFVKVMPIDYARVLERMRAVETRNSDSTSATEEVYRG